MATPFLKKAGMFDDDPEETGFGQLFKKKMPPPVPTGDVGVDPMQAGVPQNAMSFDGGGSSAPMGMPSIGAPKPKSSFLDKLGSLFGGGGSQEPERDEYGIAKPHAQRHSTLNNVLSVALPAIYGLTQDVGILPGLMAGLSNISSTKKDELEADTKRYQTERQAKEIGLRPTNLQKDYQAYVAQETAAGRQPKSLFEYQLANKQAGAMQVNPWDVYKFNEEMNFKKSEAERLAEDRRLQRESKKNDEANKPMSAEASKTFEIVDGGLRNLAVIRDRSNKASGAKGFAQFALPEVFDRDLDNAITDVTDRIGRLRSGGAISGAEEARFRKLVPGWLDSTQVKLNKLANLEAEFQGIKNRLQPQVPQQPPLAPSQPQEGGASYLDQLKAARARRLQSRGQ